MQREFCDIHALVRAMRSRGAGGCFHIFGFLQPRRQGRVREKSRAERTGIHRAHAFRFQIRNRLVGEARVLQCVLIVAQHAVHVRLLADEAEDFLRIAGEADVADFPGLLDFSQRGDRLIHDLLHRHEFDVVAEHDVEVIGAEPVQRDIDGFGHALRGKIEVRQIVASDFRAKRVALARHAFQRDAEQHFAHPASVKWRGVDEVQPALERDADARENFVERHVAEFRAERRCAEAKDGKLEIGLAEAAGFHWPKFFAADGAQRKIKLSGHRRSSGHHRRCGYIADF